MRGIQMKSWVGGVAASALLFTYGCGTGTQSTGVQAQTLANTQPAGSPVVVNCEPHQRTLVRPVMVNGSVVSQIECVAADPQALHRRAEIRGRGQHVRRRVRLVRDLGDVEEARAGDVRLGELGLRVAGRGGEEGGAIDDGEVVGAEMLGQPVGRNEIVHRASLGRMTQSFHCPFVLSRD